jgi:nucleoside-diphosphate-sugar epimerase
MTDTKPVLVTGGGGFLGERICFYLREKNYRVRSFSRQTYPSLEKLGVECHQGSLTSYKDIKKAFLGVQAVIHTASKAGVWGSPREYQETNVLGTEHVIRACLELGIPRLVYTSSPSVVFGGESIEGLSEKDCPYPKDFFCPYQKTKKEAEEAVLRANSPSLKTLALRPHLIWGPGDPHFVPRLLERAHRLRIIGDRTNKADVIWVDNAAIAHVQALERLEDRDFEGGKAYFLGQETPVVLWDFIERLLACYGKGPIKKHLSFSKAYRLGQALETVYRWLPPGLEPPMTRFLALQLSRSHYFSHREAETDLGYQPIVSIEEGFRQLVRKAQTGKL